MDFKESKPIYLQIADRLCDEILQGIYKPHERIPSVREYAAVVEVNANTTMRSYDYLQAADIIYNKRGVGYFVAADARQLIIDNKKRTFLNDEINYFFKQLLALGVSAEELAEMYKDFGNNH